MKYHLYERFFFKLLLSHSLKILVIFCRNIFAVLYWSANHISGLGAILLVSALPPVFVFLVSTTQCLAEDCSSSKYKDDKCP